MAILKQPEAGMPAPELYREHGISIASFYKLHPKYGVMDASMISRVKELGVENVRLKNMYAVVQLQADDLKEVSQKSYSAISPQ